MKRGIVKLTAMFLALACVLTCVSCGNGNPAEPVPTDTPVPEYDLEKSPEERGETEKMAEMNAETINAAALEARYVSDGLTDNGKAAVSKAREEVKFMIETEAGVTVENMAFSQVSYDNSARVAKVMRKSLNGEKITLGILGDSIPAGTGASEASKSLGIQIKDFWNECFHPEGMEGNAEYVNASIGSNSLLNVCHRMDDDLQSHNPDIVVFSVWTTHDSVHDKAAFESMLVKLLDQGCAVIVLVVTADNGANNTGFFKKTATEYHVPLVSWAQAFQKSKLKWSNYGADSIHPNDKGHAGMAASVCLYLLSVAENLPEISENSPEMPAEAVNKSGRLFVNATLWDRNDAEKFTIESLGCFKDGDMTLSSFRTYNGWMAEGAGDPIVFKVSGVSSIMLLLGHRTSTGVCNIKIEDADSGKVLQQGNADCTSTYDYSWNTGVVKDTDNLNLRITVTPAGGTYILGLMVTPK